MSHAKVKCIDPISIIRTLLIFILALVPINGTCNIDSRIPIEHIIILVQESRSFDHYFGTYPGANGLSDDIALPILRGRM